MEVFECHGLRSCKGDALELSDYVATGILVGVVLVSQLVFQLDKIILILPKLMTLWEGGGGREGGVVV